MTRSITKKISLFVGILFLMISSIYLDIKNDIKLVAPFPTQLIYDRNGYFLSESNTHNNDNFGYWSVSHPVPAVVKQSLIYAEDHRFYKHYGVDPYSLLRSFTQNLMGYPRQGASTIAMQVARMQRRTKRTYWNKLCEMVIATGLVFKFGHEAVLNHYLKLMPQGNRIHGITYSARRYFRKPLKDLNWAEASILTALTKAPGRMNLFSASGFKLAQKRAALILNRLKKHHIINNDQWEKARYLLGNLYLPVKEERPYNSYHAILKIESEIRQKQKNIPINHPITANIDLRIQDQIEQKAEKFIDYYRHLGAGNIGVMVVDLESSGILSYLGSMAYDDSKYSGSIDYNATQRSSGSILKPFVFAQGLESELFQPQSILVDGPMSIRVQKGVLAINNYDGLYLGPLIYRQALANSRNIPAVQIVKKVGTGDMMSLFKKLKLVEVSESEDYYGLGMAIGGIYVSLEKLISAYGTLAQDGRLFHAKWLSRLSISEKPSQVISQPISRLIKLFLVDPQARLPSFPRMGNLEYSFSVAVKTGTSQGFRDAWTVAFSSKYLVGIWMGHPGNSPMKKVSGVAVAALTKQILLMLEKKYPALSEINRFKQPKSYQLVKVCAASGGFVLENCSEVISEFIHPDNKSTKIQHDLVLIDTRTGNLANENTPAMALKIKKISINQSDFLTPFSNQSPLNTSVFITEPLNGSRYIMDASIPAYLQTIVLRAAVEPLIPKLDWYINGLKYQSSSPPHQIRWQLQPGKHRVQAKFPNAKIISETIAIEVGY